MVSSIQMQTAALGHVPRGAGPSRPRLEPGQPSSLAHEGFSGTLRDQVFVLASRLMGLFCFIYTSLGLGLCRC